MEEKFFYHDPEENENPQPIKDRIDELEYRISELEGEVNGAKKAAGLVVIAWALYDFYIRFL